MEVCVDSVQSAINAERGGAKRVELCCNLLEGGTTPSIGLVKTVKAKISVPVFVMIRPRGGDFLYTTEEFEVMKEDAKEVVKQGVQGVVFGILLRNGKVDIPRCQELLDVVKPAAVTFHRAFDMVCDQRAALETIIKLGFSRVLTSGGKQDVFQGIYRLKELIDQAGDRIIIVPGGGINEDNLGEILQVTGAKEYHGSAKIQIDSEMEYYNQNVCMGSTKEEYKQRIASVEIIECLTSIAKKVGVV